MSKKRPFFHFTISHEVLKLEGWKKKQNEGHSIFFRVVTMMYGFNAHRCHRNGENDLSKNGFTQKIAWDGYFWWTIEVLAISWFFFHSGLLCFLCCLFFLFVHFLNNSKKIVFFTLDSFLYKIELSVNRKEIPKLNKKGNI